MKQKLMNNRFLLLSFPTTGVLAFFAPIHALFMVITILVLIDCITAIMSYFKKTPAKKKSFWGRISERFGQIESKKLRRTAIKFVFYNIFIGLVYAVTINIFSDYALEAARGAFGLLALVELKSVAENCSYITGNTAFLNFFSMFSKKMTDKINDKISEKE